MLLAGALAHAQIARSDAAAGEQDGGLGHVAVQQVQAQEAPVVEDSDKSGEDDWWPAGFDHPIPEISRFRNGAGSLGFLVQGGVSPKGHPFFEAIGSNGRACVTCHQPAAAMSVTPHVLRERWAKTHGRDPVFAAVDGSNCPSLPQDQAASHSLLLEHGLFRIFLPWPPRNPDGSKIAPEFTVTVVSDPSGCNLDKTYGLKSAVPMISVFRRPRMAANLKYSTGVLGRWDVKLGKVLPRDPQTGAYLNNNILSDNRQNTLEDQAIEAAITHLQMARRPDAATVRAIVDMERRFYVAQSADNVGGSLRDGGAQGGPEALLAGKPAVLGVIPGKPPFPEFEGWRTSKALRDLTGPSIFPRQPAPAARPDEARESADQKAFRDSVARGYEIYAYRTFTIDDVSRLNSVGVGNPLRMSCTNCHNMQRTGMDNAPGYMDIGTANLPRQAIATPYLPVFRIQCRKDAPPHPYLGRSFLTHDLGRGLISGKCADVGAINMQQLRGLAARAPYFSNGLAKSIPDVVDFYDKRFAMKLTPHEKIDLANFLRVL